MKSSENLKQAVANYGGMRKLTPAQQLGLLKHIFTEAIHKPFISEESRRRLIELNAELDALEVLEQKAFNSALIAINKFLASLEQTSEHGSLKDNLKEQGLYRILYHKTNFKGEDDQSGLKTLMKLGFGGVALSAVFVTFFALAVLLSAPITVVAIASGLFAASVAHIAAISYGVVNDIFATRASLPYFLVGHQPQQRSLLRTNDPLAQGVAWGVAAVFVPAVIAAVVFGVSAVIISGFLPLATFVFPVMLLAMPLIAVGAEIYSRKKAREYVDSGYTSARGSNAYQIERLKIMAPTKEEQAAHMATNDRNLFGFTKVPFIGIGALVALMVLTGVSLFLPAVLFSPIVMVVVPVACAALAIIALAALGIYTYVNRNTQVDNRFKLDFSAADEVLSEDERRKNELNFQFNIYNNPNQKPWIDELYLDEDMPLVNKVYPITSVTEPTINQGEMPSQLSPNQFFEPRVDSKKGNMLQELENTSTAP